ncbi:ABC transporter substrate-binding protein [Phytomonospora endophytica]|uniref:Peptide/nickel transport system substrate-binding protein n=1 Tax=Phytomonospora endophytica TaxID=714109 RepID=A0A841FPN1_9ACTN|nr:ABC transporter substrate-binding protein [Phytomonospora endophytica]MBB6036803.1 peptide/nickel transport system substrate-binding protein [Phytomonospora endophytica]GIG68163.1 hypothetical protein Pen01_44580 [Phytomonospora endophytica]
MTSQFDISRRRLLQLMGLTAVAATGVGALGACAADDGDGGQKSGGEFTGVYDFNRDTQNMNVADNNGALLMSSIYSDLFMTTGAIYDWASKAWIYQLIESSAWEGPVLTVNVRKGVKWSDGTDVVAADFHQTYAALVLNTPAWGDAWPFVKQIEAADDHTLKLTFENPYPGIERPVLKQRVWAKSSHGVLGDKAIALLADGVKNGDDEQVAFNDELLALKPTDYVCSGPFKLDLAQSSDTVLSFVKNTGGFAASTVRFDKVTIYKGDNKAAAQFLVERKLDYATNAFTPTEQETFTAVPGLKLLETPGYDGAGLMFNYAAKPELKDVRVRKALAYAINFDQVGKIARGSTYYVSKYHNGLPDVHSEELFTPEQLATFTVYGNDTAKAEALLNEAGWSKKDGSWLLPDGKKASYEIIGVAGWNDFELTATQVQEAWTAFGIETKASNVPADNPWGVWGSGSYEIAVRHWGNPFNPDYWGSGFTNFQMDNGRTEETPGQMLDLKMTSPTLGEVDLDALILTSKTAPDLEAQKEACRKIATIFNELLPRIPIWGYKYVSPSIEGVRVEKFDTAHSTNKNQVYQDNPVILSVLDGRLGPA